MDEEKPVSPLYTILSRAVEQSPSIVMVTDTRGIIEYVNPKFSEITGYSREEAVGMNAAELGEASPEELQRMWGVLNSGGEWRGEFLNRKKNGQRYWESASISSIKDERRDIVRFVKVAEDVTERKRVEAALRESEERFRQLADNILEVFWMTDPEKNQMIYISPGYETVWGRHRESLYASPRSWLDAIHPEDRDRVRDAALSKQVRGDYDEEYRILRPDGSIRWIHDRAFPVRDPAGKVRRIAGIAEDVTERKRAADMLARLQAERVANVSTMAGLTAHEVGNPASIIVGHTYLLKEKVHQLRLQGLPGWEGLHESTEAIEKAVNQIQNVTRALTAVVRPPEPAQLVDVNRLLDDTARLLSPRFRSGNVTVAKELDPNLPPVPGNTQELNQTFLNLLLNALQAMPSGGALTLRTRRSAGFLEASVSDTGGGMSEEVQRRIFQPFFTTKPNGSGLGLVMAKSAAEQHGGTLSFESRPGQGTTFILRLPLPREATAP